MQKKTRYKKQLLIVRLLLFFGSALHRIEAAQPELKADAASTRPIAGTSADNLSFQNEIQHSIDQGLSWLKSNQNSNGWWADRITPPSLPSCSWL